MATNMTDKEKELRIKRDLLIEECAECQKKIKEIQIEVSNLTKKINKEKDINGNTSGN